MRNSIARALICIVAVMLPLLAVSEEAFTVDHMLRNQSIGKVLLSPDGSTLVYELHMAFEDQGSFAHSYVRGQHRSRIYAYDLKNGGEPWLLFEQNESDGYTLGDFSPDGTRVSYLRLSEGQFRAGLFDFLDRDSTGKPIESGFTPALSFYASKPWLSNSELVFATTADGELPTNVSMQAEADDKLAAAWKLKRRGKETTDSAIGSGKFSRTDALDNTGDLLLVDAATGNTRKIGSGDIEHWALSPAASRIAALVSRPMTPNPSSALEHATAGGVTRELVMIDGGSDSKPVAVCPDCDVIRNGMTWSADGKSFAFFARKLDDSWENAGIFRYDTRTQSASAVDLCALTPKVRRGSFDLAFDPRIAWIGDDLLVYAEPGEKEEGASVASKWYALGKGKCPTDIGESFGDQPYTAVAITNSSMIVLSNGDLWSVSPKGNRELLTYDISEPVSMWMGASNYMYSTKHEALDRADSLILESKTHTDNNHVQSRQLLFLDLLTNTTRAINAPGPDARVFAADPVSGTAIYYQEKNNAGTLYASNVDGRVREIVSINEHLTGLHAGNRVRLDHTLPNGTSVTSWILLPPGYKKDEPVATIVKVYPGWTGSKEMPNSLPFHMSALNSEILSAQGYAILFPSLPASYFEVPRDPLVGLADDVLSAVDAAIDEGYADPDRLGILGHSYGGYATMGIISQTDRFKTAVAMSGIYNLTSMYGVFDVRRQLGFERTGLNLFGASWAETSQGGMGAPPWQDPDRYIRNSPLFQVQAVSTPVMLIHGDRDFIPISEAEQMFTALFRLNKDAIFVRYWGEGHVFSSPANIRDSLQRISKWFAEYLDNTQ